MSIPGSALTFLGAASGGDADYQISRSLRFNDDDSAYLSKTFSSQGDCQTYTISLWTKRGELGINCNLFNAAGTASTTLANNERTEFRFTSADKLQFSVNSHNPSATLGASGSTLGWKSLFTPALFKDPSAWYHIVVSVDTTQATASDRVTIWVNGVEQAVSGDYPTLNEVTPYGRGHYHTIGAYANGTNAFYNGYLADVHFVDGQALDKTSFGGFDPDTGVWNPKEYSGTHGTNGFHLDFSDNSSIAALGYDAAGSNDWTPTNLEVNSNLYVTNALTAVNGVMEVPGDPFWIDILPTNADVHYAAATNTVNMAAIHDGLTTTSAYWVGNLNNVENGGNVTRARFDLTSFGTITSCRVYGGFPAGYVNYKYRMLDSSKTEISGSDGTFGNYAWHTMQVTGNPKYIEISCEHSTSTDTRHRTHAIEVNGVVLVNGGKQHNDSFIDSPSNYEADTGNNGGNYCTWNPLDEASGVALANGNLDMTQTAAGGVKGTIGVTSGKWYWEITKGSTANQCMGIATSDANPTTYAGGYAGSCGWATNGGYLFTHQTSIFTRALTAGSGFETATTNDVLGFALDLDSTTKTLKFYKNGSLITTDHIVIADSNLHIHPVIGTNVADSGANAANFGQRPFANTPPDGFKSLCTQNLPDPTIEDGSQFMDSVIWDGDTNSQSKDISGLNFKPDFVWAKKRDGTTDTTARSHVITDAVRGAGVHLISDLGNDEANVASNIVTAFNSDGFTAAYHQASNWVNSNFVAWAWDAGANSSKTYAVTVVSGQFRFDGFGSGARTLDLEEGSTYVFDQSDSSNATHPLRFATAADAAGNTEYTTGVTTTGTPGQAGAKTTITVASGAPTLYYYCSSHTGMGGQANTNDTAGASNFDGSIQSTVRANSSVGFSIVNSASENTGGTIGHGLNAAPSFVIGKSRDVNANWAIWHQELTGTDYWIPFTYGAESQLSGVYNGFNSSTFTIGGSWGAASEKIFYCWAEVEGYSKFGSYTGNGSTTGGEPFVYTGFRPGWLMIKALTGAPATDWWFMWDTARETYNTQDKILYANSNLNEDSGTDSAVDILSNGFRWRCGNYAGMNESNTKYIYMAFAENPFKYSRAR